MLLLAVDTSGKYGSIALAQCGPEEHCEIIEVVPLEGGTFSAQLVPQIAALMAKHGFSKTDIAAFAVASGPGSFTGLRVGLAAVKALAEILGKPIAAVSILEAVAAACRPSDLLLAGLDAGRGEVYIAEYEDGILSSRGERLLSQEEFLQTARNRLVVTPDDTIAKVARTAARQVAAVEHPRSDAIARLGWRKIAAGKTVSTEELEANYIRRSDAEIFSSPAASSLGPPSKKPRG